MSALEQASLPSDRRRADRTRLNRVLRALVGRNEGVFVDLSLRGAKIRHEGAVRRGATVRIVFAWERERFSTNAEVLASRVISLGAREGESAIYESRFRFETLEPAACDLLARVLIAIPNDELRSWIGNLKGFDDTQQANTSKTAAAAFVRCRRVGIRWEKKWTRDTSQPIDGFLLPAGTDPAEVAALCKTWDEADADARQLLRLTASAVVEEALR